MENFREIHRKIQEANVERSGIKGNILRYKSKLKHHEERLIAAQEAQTIIQRAATETQRHLEEYIGGVVTMALAFVDPDAPELIVRMIERRGESECDLLFKEGDREQHPLECSGFGFADIADQTLRAIYILLKSKKGDSFVRKTLILDEPFRNVDPEMQYKASEMQTMLSEELGFQFLMVSHADGAITGADKVFRVRKKGKFSQITEEEN